MFPQVPQDISALGESEIEALLAQFAEASKTLAGQTLSPEQAAEIKAARADHGRLSARLAEIQAEQADFQANADFLASLSADPDDGDEDGDDGDDADGEDLATGDADADADADADDADAEEKEEVTASTKLKSVTATRPKRIGTHGDKKPVVTDKQVAADQLLSTGLGGVADKGEAFGSWLEVAEASLKAASETSGSSTKRDTVARAVATYDDAHTLTDDPLWNLRLFENELRAAMCAPAVPNYTLGCANTDRRPVFNSAPRFAAPRGAVSIYPSPTLEDITDGIGIWDRDDDANPSAVKEACQTIDCADPSTYYLYGVYRCLTVKNLTAMTFPELVEAYLNRLSAAWARLAETQLLNTMGAAATAVMGQNLGYGGSTSITTTILTLITLHQESQRWDVSGNMHAWLPRWVMYAMKADLYRQRNVNGGSRRFVSDAEINALLRDAGVNPTWFIDTPTWAAPIPAVQTGGMLNFLPTTVDILIAPEGKFAFMDRGELRIGVTGNNIYRDNTSNSRNEFTYFFESFEGVVDTDSCPAYLLEVPACWNGVQIADVELECDGTREGS